MTKNALDARYVQHQSALAIGLCSTILFGCAQSIKITEPANNSQQSSPVSVVGEFHNRADQSTFSARLDGNDVTNQFTVANDRATATLAMSPGDHTIRLYADFRSRGSGWQVQDEDDEHTFTVAAPPPLTFSPSSLSLILGQPATSVAVNLPSTSPNATTVSLAPSGNFISVNGAQAGQSTSITIPANTASGSFTAQATAAGSGSILATPSGSSFSAASLGVSVPTPRYTLEVQPAEAHVVWGSTANYTVTLTSQSGFAQTVDLSASDLPAGTSASFGSTSVAVPAGGSPNTTLAISGPAAQVLPGETRFRVTGQTPGLSDRRDDADIIIHREPGAFTNAGFSLTTANDNCGPVNASVVAAGGPRVIFDTPIGNSNSLAIGAGYQISPQCRVGVVVPPAQGTPPNTFFNLNLANLFFPADTGAPGVTTVEVLNNTVATGFWFSPDESIVAIEGPTGGVGTPRTTVLILYDVVTRRSRGSIFYDGTLTSIVLNDLNNLSSSGRQTVTINGPALPQPATHPLP